MFHTVFQTDDIHLQSIHVRRQVKYGYGHVTWTLVKCSNECFRQLIVLGFRLPLNRSTVFMWTVVINWLVVVDKH